MKKRTFAQELLKSAEVFDWYKEAQLIALRLETRIPKMINYPVPTK